MTDSSRVLLTTVIGAAVGAAAGFLFLTEAGRDFRQDLEPRLDDFAHELRKLRMASRKARMAVDEGWRTVVDMTDELTASRS